jgi:hypothetical protein
MQTLSCAWGCVATSRDKIFAAAVIVIVGTALSPGLRSGKKPRAWDKGLLTITNTTRSPALALRATRTDKHLASSVVANPSCPLNVIFLKQAQPFQE